jgi:hypothetical protein
MNRTTTKCDEVNPIITFKNELKRIFEEKFSGKIGTNFSPFFTRIEENFDGKTGVLFVGKADNIEGRPQSIEAAFSQINGDYIRQIAEGCSGYHRSAYVRTSHEIAKELKKKGMTCFARTNLYKLRLLQNPSRSPPTAAIARGFGRRKCLFDGRSMQ